MTQIQQQFFALLRAGLWGKAPDASLFGAGTDWAALLAAAKKQSVQAVVLDGVQLLPADCRPPKPIYLQWCALSLHTEEQNELLNRELNHLYALMRAHGIEPVLVKGQAVAQCYRHPEHRRCGDIDFYIGLEDYERANALLRPEATQEEEEIFKHACMHWHGVIVENHRILISLSRPAADRRMQQLTAVWGRDKAACPLLRVGETEARVPPAAFHTAYVLTHAALRHGCSVPCWCANWTFRPNGCPCPADRRISPRPSGSCKTSGQAVTSVSGSTASVPAATGRASGTPCGVWSSVAGRWVPWLPARRSGILSWSPSTRCRCRRRCG